MPIDTLLNENQVSKIAGDNSLEIQVDNEDIILSSNLSRVALKAIYAFEKKLYSGRDVKTAIEKLIE